MKKMLLLKTVFGFAIIVSGLFLTFHLYRSRSESLPVEAKVFEAPKVSSSSLEQVFKNPSPVTIDVMDTGGVGVTTSKALNFEHPNAKGLENEKIDLRVFSYLIRHEKYGDYLIDTGLGASVQGNKYGKLKGLMVSRIAQGYTQEKGRDVAAQLKERGITPRGIFFTHLHYDHTSGLEGLPKDIQSYFGNDETYWNYKFIYESDYLKGFKNLNKFDFSHAEIMNPLGPAIDIFGDGSVWAVSTPGHTKGHVSYLVNAKEGSAFIAGDASLVQYGLKSGIGPGSLSSDVKVAQKTFDKIMEFHRMYPQVKIYCGHELP